MLIDFLEKSIGKLRLMQKQLLLRIINPIIWLREIVRLPFHLIGWAGFNQSKFELSFWGKLIKLINQIVLLLAALCTIFLFTGITFDELITWFIKHIKIMQGK